MGSEYMNRLAMMLAQRDPQGVGRPGAGRIADALMSRERSIPQSLPSPGVLADPEPFVSQEYFGGYDDGLRATPYTADIPDVPSRGEQRAAVMPHDPAMMDAEMGALRGYKQSPLRQRLDNERTQRVDAMRGQYGDFASEFPQELFPALDGLPIDDQGAAQMLGQMAPQDRENFYLYATQMLRDSGGSSTQPIGRLLQEWQGMTPDRRGMAVTGAKDWLGRPSEGAGRQDKQGLRDREALVDLGLNVTESQRTGFGARMMQAEEVLRRLEQQGTRTGQRMLEWLPGEMIENHLFDDEYRQYRQAEDAFLNSALRADTGATINESEIPRLRAELMPRAGDDAETIAQKRRAREAFLLSILAASGPAASLLPEIGQPVVPIEQGAPDFSAMSDEELLRALQGGN